MATLNPHGTGGYLLVYDKPYGDFELKCDVKMDQPDCNSGIFLRVGDLKDPVQSGIEVQIETLTKPDLHGFASFYDLVAPTKDATHGPGKWDTVDDPLRRTEDYGYGERRKSECRSIAMNGPNPASGSTARRTNSRKRFKIFRAKATSACRTTATRCGTRISN